MLYNRRFTWSILRIENEYLGQSDTNYRDSVFIPLPFDDHKIRSAKFPGTGNASAEGLSGLSDMDMMMLEEEEEGLLGHRDSGRTTDKRSDEEDGRDSSEMIDEGVVLSSSVGASSSSSMIMHGLSGSDVPSSTTTTTRRVWFDPSLSING